jgi:hypothetical protein
VFYLWWGLASPTEACEPSREGRGTDKERSVVVEDGLVLDSYAKSEPGHDTVDWLDKRTGRIGNMYRQNEFHWVGLDVACVVGLMSRVRLPSPVRHGKMSGCHAIGASSELRWGLSIDWTRFLPSWIDERS